MRRILLILFFTSLFFIVKAQDSTYRCSTPDLDTSEFAQLPWFDNNQVLEDFLDSIGYPSQASRIMDGNIKYWIPIKFWIYRDNNGNGGPTNVQIQNMMDNLNRLYNQANNTWIGFYMKCEPTYINNSSNLRKTMAGATILISDHRELGCINVHVVDQISDGTVVGYAIAGLNGLIIDRTSYTNVPTPSYLTHEIGHVLGLVHTHMYAHFPIARRCFVECVSRNRSWPFTSLCFAPRFKKVCESTGDALKDTPADPDLSLNNSCGYTLGGSDPWGDSYPAGGSEMPETANIMSYNGDDNCVGHFSRLQIAVMLRTLKHGKIRIDVDHWKDNRYTFDSYEPDNSADVARSIVLNEVQEHNFHQQYEYSGLIPNTIQCDVDWVRFTPTCSGNFIIETAGISGRTNTNTRLTLFDNNLNQLAQNDDISGSNLYSSISFNFNSGNTYFIRVENMLNGTTGYYQLSVKHTSQVSGPDVFCGQTTYTATNLPTGSSVIWSVVPSGIVTPTNYSGNPFTVTGTANGDFTLTAQINACGQNYTLTKPAHVGAPPTPGPISWTWNAPPGRVLLQVDDVIGATSYKWYLDGTIKATTAYPTYQLQMRGNVSCGNAYYFAVVAVNNCGTSGQSYTYAEMPPCDGFAYTVSPNPSSGNIKVQSNAGTVEKSNTNTTADIRQIELVDKSGIVRQKQSFAAGTTTTTFSVSTLPNDIYTLRIFDGQTWHATKIMVQH